MNPIQNKQPFAGANTSEIVAMIRVAIYGRVSTERQEAENRPQFRKLFEDASHWRKWAEKRSYATE